MPGLRLQRGSAFRRDNQVNEFSAVWTVEMIGHAIGAPKWLSNFRCASSIGRNQTYLLFCSTYKIPGTGLFWIMSFRSIISCDLTTAKCVALATERI